MHLTSESVADGALRMLPQAGSSNFDVCIVELSNLEAPLAAELLDAVAGRLKHLGTLIVHWHDQGTVPLRSVHSQIVQFTLDRGCNASAHYAGSWASARAGRKFRQARSAPTWRRLVSLVWWVLLAVLAELRERSRRNQVTTIPKYCSSATFRIELPSPEVIDAIQGQIGWKSQRPALTEAQPRTRKTQAAQQRNGDVIAVAGLSEGQTGDRQ